MSRRINSGSNLHFSLFRDLGVMSDSLPHQTRSAPRHPAESNDMHQTRSVSDARLLKASGFDPHRLGRRRRASWGNSPRQPMRIPERRGRDLLHGCLKHKGRGWERHQARLQGEDRLWLALGMGTNATRPDPGLKVPISRAGSQARAVLSAGRCGGCRKK